jgi:glycosyltransferase involved in cell wall biosynthesis
MPRISICLPVFNGANYVEDALASIAAQTCKDYVVLASDNASSDDTGAILRKWSGRIPIDIVTQEKTIPMQAHFDSVLNRIKSDTYMLLCHDDYFQTADALEKALAVLDNQPSVSAVYCDLAYVSERGATIATRRFKRAGTMDADTVGKQSLRTARNMFGIPLLVRTAALGNLRYDGRFKYIVDVDLSWTISKNTEAWHIPEIMIANRYSASNSTWGMLKDTSQEFLALARKHGIMLTPADRMDIRFTSWYIGVCKNMFGVYERLRTRLGV